MKLTHIFYNIVEVCRSSSAGPKLPARFYLKVENEIFDYVDPRIKQKSSAAFIDPTQFMKSRQADIKKMVDGTGVEHKYSSTLDNEPYADIVITVSR